MSINDDFKKDMFDIKKDMLAVIDGVFSFNPDKVAQAKENPFLIGWFIGQVLKASDGKAEREAVETAIKDVIHEK